MGTPTIKFYQFSSSGVNPVGSRHLTSHESFIKELGESSAGKLDFGKINISSPINHSATKAVIARVSNLDGGTAVENMRFWAPSLPNPPGTVSFNFTAIQPYISGIGLTTASGQIPTSLPVEQNLFRTDGGAQLTGVDDANVSEWIYLNVTAENDVTPRKHGGDSGFRFLLTYDYY